ncbi:hypothetical protein [Nonomuraea sp. PA05]|uniref:hypothetical protein n=1 Tax=Nonomuraea sp. PA05 TaxID=2604466 RepID=UPI0016521E16|nr:hypothetical protein [Nonomuraea sp. PA05]
MLPECCEKAVERGEYDEHRLVCVHRSPAPVEEPETEPLFDIDPPKTEEGGPLL